MAINYGKLNAKMTPRGSMIARMGVSGPLNSDYEALINKPQINGNELIGNKTNEDLGIPTKTSDLDNDLNFVADENYVHTDNNYDDTDKGKVDALGTASRKNVPAEGNASASEVVMGSDTRLTDSRNAKDVYDWAKAQTKPSYGYSEIQDTPAINNSTITIQKNNQNVDNFTLNQDSNKSINISVPTKTSDLQNDNSFITNTVNNLANYYLKTQTYTQAEVDALIQAAINGRFQKVNTLPASGEPNVIYLVPKTTPETSNACDEYIWQDNAWELIGSTEIDLSDYVTDEDLATTLQSYLTTSAFATAIANYYTKTEVGTLLNDKVDKVNGKGLSTYDYDATAKAIVDSVTVNLAAKVDKVAGKGLSTNDYDNTAKGIVDGVTSALAGKVDKVDGKGLSTNDYTTEEKTKLNGISTGANKVEASDTNGNIKIDNEETQVYDDSGIQGKISTALTPISGNPISISGLKSTQLAVDPVITFEPIQAGSGTPSPENIRPISGYDKIEVLSCGKNLFDKSKVELGKISTTTGEDESASDIYRYKDYIYLKSNTRYTIGSTNGQTVRIFYYSDNAYIGTDTFSSATSIDTGNNIKRIRFQSREFQTVKEILQIEEGATATTYSPYHKTTDLSESLGQTVYGGTLDLNSGVLTVDEVYLNLKGLTADTYAGTGVFFSNVLDRNVFRLNGICSHAHIRTTEPTWKSGEIQLGANNASVYWSDILTVMGKTITEFNTWLASEDVVICYKTPNVTTIQLTPHEISLLEQYAYVSTNGTTIALKYHNGEVASLGDVEELYKTVERDIVRSLHAYSTTEQVVGTWIDGKPLYEKVMIFQSPFPTFSNQSYLFSSGVQTDTTIQLYAIYKTTSGIDYIIPFNEPRDSTYERGIRKNNNTGSDDIIITTKTGNEFESTAIVYIIFQYTKTTD